MPDITAFSLIAAIDIWGAVLDFMAMCLEGLYKFTAVLHIPSYALAICILALIIKVLLYPLMKKQMRSMREMQKVQPLMNEINEKYKSNPQKKQEEMLKVYQKYKVNPAAGCLPLLIQMPILIAIFQMLRNFEPANPGAYQFFWIPDLSSQDPTGIVLPIIVVITSLAQQYVNTTNKKDPTQKAMLITMPLMMGFFARTMPAGLGIYWAMISILGALQQIFFNEKGKKEDEKIEATEEAEKQAKKEKKAEAIARSKEEKALATQKRITAANANAPLNAQGKKKKVVIGPDGQPLKRKIENNPNNDNTDNKK